MDRQTISKMVKASGVSAGEMILVHFWGEDEDKGIANDFMVSVAGLGATPVLLQQSRQINRDIFLAAKESCFGAEYFDFFTKFDAVLDRDGQVCGSNQPEITAFFEKQPQENRVVCELGFGMNPNVRDLCGYNVLDEKMCDTFHIAVGANHMFGGTNEASDHIDFVGRGTIVI